MSNQTTDRLQQDLQKLEAETEARDIFRLAQARNRALSQEDLKPKGKFLPALGAAMASLFLVSFLLFQETPPTLNNEIISEIYTEETVVEFDDEYIDLYEDLDFYYWLADNNQDAPG